MSENNTINNFLCINVYLYICAHVFIFCAYASSFVGYMLRSRVAEQSKDAIQIWIDVDMHYFQSWMDQIIKAPTMYEYVDTLGSFGHYKLNVWII